MNRVTRRNPGPDRDAYDRAGWTLKACAICGAPDYELYPAIGDDPRSRLPADMRFMVNVPLCRRHHRYFRTQVWPLLKGKVSVTIALLAFISAGEKFDWYLDWWRDD
jgi:hypothetical protein